MAKTYEHVSVGVSPQVKELVEKLRHATDMSERDVMDVIISSLEGPAHKAVLEVENFKKLAASWTRARAREALEVAEAAAAELGLS